MQAPMQRGKKRGTDASAVLFDAGRKRLKREGSGEGKQRPPFVCDIYRRDVASFLSRVQIQQWRQTSRFSNAALSMYPHRLAHFKYERLTVVFASADQCRVKRNGFLYRRSADGMMAGKEFNAIFKFRLCCCDVRDRAALLVGQRLFPGKPDDEGVTFQLSVRYLEEVVCRAPNLLTSRTAPAMLHFLHHLSHQACFKRVEILPGPTADAAECALNPLVLRALPKFQLRAVVFDMHNPELSVLTVQMAVEMGIRFNALRCDVDSGEGLAALLHCIATGRHLTEKLSVILTSQLSIDRIVRYFEKEVRSLARAIRDVHWLYLLHWADWPASCPRKAATQVTKRSRLMTKYRYEFANAHSGEPFSMLMGARRYGGKTEIYEFHLKFGSA